MCVRGRIHNQPTRHTQTVPPLDLKGPKARKESQEGTWHLPFPSASRPASGLLLLLLLLLLWSTARAGGRRMIMMMVVVAAARRVDGICIKD